MIIKHNIFSYAIILAVFIIILIFINCKKFSKEFLRLVQLGTLALAGLTYILFVILTGDTTIEFLIGGIYYKPFTYQFEGVNILYILSYIGLFGTAAYLAVGDLFIGTRVLDRIVVILLEVFVVVRIIFLQMMEDSFYQGDLSPLVYNIFAYSITMLMCINLVAARNKARL